LALGLIRRYVSALRDERKLRIYLMGSFVDDVGVAVSGWASRLLMVALFTDQRQRAKLMLPSLLCFLLGTFVAGPLADWAARGTAAQLARWRWRVVVWGRVIETVALGLLIRGVSDEPTIASVAPYVFVSAFMKTTMRPTRNAFHVDLLSREEPQVGPDGVPISDERGAPRMYKTHLLSFDSMTSFLNSTSLLGGLLLGGKILGWASGRYVPLYVIDVATNLVFIAFVFFGCHPDRSASKLGISDLLRDPEPLPPIAARAAEAKRSIAIEALREVFGSFREALRFLSRPEQRPLVTLLLGSLLFEWIYESYDGGMIVKQVLQGTDEQFRHVEIAWTCTTIAVLAVLPLLARWVSSLGKIFFFTMLVDGFVIAMSGRACGLGAAGLMPVAILLGADRALTSTSDTLAGLAQNSASSAAIRGRIAAFYAFVAIVGDIVSEVGATAASEAWGIPGMLVRIGLGQALIILVLGVLGGRRFWSFGLRVDRVTSAS
jgi:hypothetical protein